MKNISHWLVVALLVTALLPMTAGAQGQQWLQYRSSREPKAIAGYISMPFLKPTSEHPDSANLPDLKEEPLLYKWSSPLAKDGFLYIALDRETGSGARDLLYVDSNGDGNLRDETAIAAYTTDPQHSYFGPVKVTFQEEDGPIVYHLNFRLCDHHQRLLRVSSAGWYEGSITVSGQQKFCVLIDHNANGAFNDKSLNAAKCDRIRIGDTEHLATSMEHLTTSFVGNYINIGGVLYRPVIARDGAFVKLAKAEGVTFGIVRLPKTISQFSVCGENGLFSFVPVNGLCSLPVGKYRVHSWTMVRQDKKGLWELRGSSASDKGVFDVTGDKETELSIGEPIISAIEARGGSGSYTFNHKLQGRLDERIDLERNGSRPEAPKLRIRSKDGRYNKNFAFAYG